MNLQEQGGVSRKLKVFKHTAGVRKRSVTRRYFWISGENFATNFA